MQKTFSFLFAFAILLLTVGCNKTAADATAPGGTDWSARAAAYKQNPEALRQLVEACESDQRELTQVRQELNQYRNQSGDANAALTAARQQAAAAQNEIAQLRQQLAAAQSSIPAEDRLDTDLTTVQGVIFQVQLGAFAQNQVDPSLSTGDELQLDNQNGLQKFVVSQFRNYSSAEILKNRLVKMGVKDAFIIAKNNGTRIPVPEALRITGQN